jgi:hypothetical protein
LQQRQSVTLAEVAAHTGTDEKAVGTMLHSLVEQGSLLELEVAGERRYRPRRAPKKGRQLCKNIWQKLEEHPIFSDRQTAAALKDGVKCVL